MMPAVPITKVPDGMLRWDWFTPPFDLAMVEIWREGWTDTHVIPRDSSGLTGLMNINGLYWREPRERAPETSHALN